MTFRRRLQEFGRKCHASSLKEQDNKSNHRLTGLTHSQFKADDIDNSSMEPVDYYGFLRLKSPLHSVWNICFFFLLDRQMLGKEV